MTFSEDLESSIKSAIQDVVKFKCEELIQKHKDKFEQELNQILRESVAQVGLTIATQICFEDRGSDLHIVLHDKRIKI